MRIKQRALLSCLFFAFIGAANADELSGTLKKIKSSGTINIGHRDSSFPFSYYDDQKKVVGFSIDLCDRVVDDIKKTLSLPDLKTNYVLVSSSDRISKVVDGTVDLECGSTSITKDRMKEVAFSNITFVAASKVLIRTDSGIKTSADLKGKRIVVNQGSTNASDLLNFDQKKDLKIQFVRSHGTADSYKMLEENKAAGFCFDDIQLEIFAAKAADPKTYFLLSDNLASSPYSIMMRKDDKPFEKLVNGTLARLTAANEFNKIYNKWFVTPQFKFPMNDALKSELKNPNNNPPD